jgi:formylglycine-generating enzyme required for sulfatase activity
MAAETQSLDVPGRAHARNRLAALFSQTRARSESMAAHLMVKQGVLRGGSCLTPRWHVRASYRNFRHSPTRFQMTGIRMARGSEHL